MTGKHLYDVYKNPSQTKVAIWERIYEEYLRLGAYNISVRDNSFTFSVTYNYIDKDNHVHEVYVSPSTKKDVIKWTYKDVKAICALSAFNGYGILDIGFNDMAISCYIYEGEISDIKETKIYSTSTGRTYIIRNKCRLYLDNFLRTDV